MMEASSKQQPERSKKRSHDKNTTTALAFPVDIWWKSCHRKKTSVLYVHTYLHRELVLDSLPPSLSHAPPQGRVAHEADDGRSKRLRGGIAQETRAVVDDGLKGPPCRKTKKA